MSFPFNRSNMQLKRQRRRSEREYKQNLCPGYQYKYRHRRPWQRKTNEMNRLTNSKYVTSCAEYFFRQAYSSSKTDQ